MKEMITGIVGGGVVGRATARAFIEHVDEVRVYDKDPERRTHDLLPTLASDIVFVCLPSPRKSGSFACDTSVIEEFFASLKRTGLHEENINLVLRSTVPIGFTRKMAETYGLTNLVHSPEFLTARCSIVDAQIPSRNIVGRLQTGKEWVTRSICSVKLTELYELRFPGVPVYDLTSDESEAVKLFQNSFFATKVAFWNECRTLADKHSLDWSSITQAILADGRIHPSHTNVPGPDGKRGFGGECLPKDLANLIDCMEGAGLSSPIIKAASYRNSKHDRREG